MTEDYETKRKQLFEQALDRAKAYAERNAFSYFGVPGLTTKVSNALRKQTGVNTSAELIELLDKLKSDEQRKGFLTNFGGIGHIAADEIIALYNKLKDTP